MRKYDDVEDCSHCLEKQRSKLKEAAAREHKHEHENISVSMSTSAADLNAIKSDVPQSHCLIVTFSISNTSVQNTFWA